MPRVNHKIVRQRLNEKRSQITDRQFFTSRILAGHFEDMAAAQTKRYRYNRRVRVNLYWDPANPRVARTDNLQIRINTGNSLVTNVRGRENRYQIVCGLFAHELGHILYTDFLIAQTYLKAFAGYRWYPEPPVLHTPAEAANEKDFWEYVKADPANLATVQWMIKRISNAIEDGYIENRMLNQFPGTLGYGLSRLREEHFRTIPSVSDLMEEETTGKRHIFESILQILLSYAKFGEIRYGEAPLSDERIQVVFDLISDIDSALLSTSEKTRLQAVNQIVIRCWSYMKELCELYRKRKEDAEAAGLTGLVEDILSAICKELSGSSEIGSGDTSSVPEMSGVTVPSSTAKERERTRLLADAAKADEKSGVAQGENQTEKSGTSGDSSATEENQISEGCSQMGTSAMDEPEKELQTGKGDISATEDGREKQADVSAEETERIAPHQTENLSEPVGGGVEICDSYRREMYDKAASDIERMLEKMAERAASAELENERLEELNEAAQNISYGDIHQGVRIRVNRIAEVEENAVTQYHSISDPLLTISRQLQRNFIRQLKDSRRGGKQTGLLMGRRLDAHALHRNDGKVFYKNALPNETPELAVALLLDESGSMGGDDRCTYARASAIILYDFCQSLDIPMMVYGHSTGLNTVELYSYAEFDSFDHDDPYRMMDIGARRSNRDGAALRFVAEQLSKRPEPIKMLILVSDGQPADWGYSGSAAEEDLRGIKQEYQRKGILFVAAAIGSDKEAIERIYGESYMDITDLTQLPVKLTNLIKQYIRV